MDNLNDSINKTIPHLKPSKLNNIINTLETITDEYNNNLVSPISKIIGLHFAIIHLLFMFGCVVGMLFSTNIFHVWIILFIVSMDCIANVVFHDCPLSMLERKYSGETLNNAYKSALVNLNIGYKCKHAYEGQLDCLITTWALVSIKLMGLIFMRCLL